MDSSESWAIGFLVLFLIVSFTFSLVKASFSAIYAKREAKDREGREEKVAALVETGGFNETISIGRIFCNVGSGVLGFFLFEMLPWAWVQQYWFLGFAAYIVVASFCIYTLTVFCANLLGNLKPDTLAVVLIPLYRYIRLPFIIPAKICHALFVKTLKGMGYDSKLSFLPEERRDAVQADLSDDNGSDGEGLEKEERQMILNIFDFVETPVREIMTPRVDMCAIDVDTPLEDLVKVLNSERHSRLPVYKETVDNIVGILSNRDFLQWYTERHEDEPLDIMKLVMPPVFVPYHKKIDDMLTELRKTGNQLAIVVDEYGGTAGLVTLEDILEEIVGEIRDEDDVDEDEDVQKLKDGRYILDPLMTLSDLEYELGVELEAPENSHVETLSGLIQATLGIIPSPGAEVVIKGYTFRVLKMDGTRMEKVLMILPGKNKPKNPPRTQAFKVV
ncbi:MAG: hemolysin family protein [Fibrobacter sp.]|nr:hemolysin family protein [Fibrobacter sp.]